MSELNGKSGSRSGQRLIPLDEALSALNHSLETAAPMEEVRVDTAGGRVLREDVRAGIDVPGHTNLAVDGYALRFADLEPGRGGCCSSLASRQQACRKYKYSALARRSRSSRVRLCQEVPIQW